MSTLPAGWPEGPLVGAGWLLRHIDGVRVLDASVTRIPVAGGATQFAPGDAAFAQAHIPGARPADLFDGFSDPAAPFPFTCPSADQLTRAARAAGIDDDTPVVVYDAMGGAYAARVWAVLRGFGHDRVRVLDGGLDAWSAAGGHLASGPARPVATGSFTARATPGIFLGTEDVARLSAAPDPMMPLVCGLRTVQFTGADSDDPRQGHIPGSINLPFPDLAPGGRIDVSYTKTALQQLGIGPDAVPVLYCGGGINAAGLALALTAAGHPDWRIYDDSMSGWRARPDLPVAKGEADA